MSQGAGSKKVLIVEDDRDAAEALRLVLEDEGYTVIQAADADQGLIRAREEMPDVILLDIMMPSGTEGFHFVWELRRGPEEWSRRIPILVLSAIHGKTRLRFHPDQQDPVYGPGEYLPVQGFLDKPSSSAELIARVRQALEEAAVLSGNQAGTDR